MSNFIKNIWIAEFNFDSALSDNNKPELSSIDEENINPNNLDIKVSARVAIIGGEDFDKLDI